MSKVQANKILKEHGLAAVKRVVPGGNYGMPKTRVLKDYDDKQIKGIHIASHSPVDCTSVKRQQADSAFAALVSDLAAVFSKVEGHGTRFIVKETKNKRTILTLTRQRFSAYSMQMDMDPGYQNEYIVPSYEEGAK